ncbi:zinc finger protein 85-like isoform X1 [Ptychodera flava]|uniref:zinc finger protein 85-like isoform X1 n=2 Tax=Ptychodera flava TaxID=63121 RepID=UPI00396A751B
MAGENVSASLPSRMDMINSLFDRGEELMEKLGCQVFILVSEDGICSSFMGSEVFLKEFCSSGLKIKQQDVLRIGRNIETQTNYWIAEDNGCGQQILLRSALQTSYDEMPANHSTKENAAGVTMVTGTSVSSSNTGNMADIEQRSVCEEGDAVALLQSMMCGALEDDSISNDDDDDSGASNSAGEEGQHESKDDATGKAGSPVNDMVDMKENCPVKRDTASPVNDRTEREERCSSNKESTPSNNTDLVRKQRRKRKIAQKNRHLRYYKFSPSDPEKHRRGIQKVFKEFYETKPNLCDKCGFSFRNPHGLEVHQQRAQCPGHRCHICGVSFPFKQWQQHMLDEHVAEIKIYECHICEKQFLRYYDLSCHLQMHEPEKTYTCDICGAISKTEECLRTHKLLHQKKQYKCDYCDYKIVRKCDLTVHMQRHIDRSKLECKECGKQLLNANSLRSHIQRFHTKLKYQCSECEKEFSVPRELRHHVERHHSGDKNLLMCEKCDKGFHTKKLLNAHLRVFHSEHPVKCQICEREFRHFSRLKSHLRVHNKSKVKKSEVKKTDISQNGSSGSTIGVAIVTDTNQSSSDTGNNANQRKSMDKRKGSTTTAPGNSKKRKTNAVKKHKFPAKKPSKKQRKRKETPQKCSETILTACTMCGFPFKKPISLDEAETSSRRRCHYCGTSIPVKEKQQHFFDNHSAEFEINE